jgi:hypothetical protein
MRWRRRGFEALEAPRELTPEFQAGAAALRKNANGDQVMT